MSPDVRKVGRWSRAALAAVVWSAGAAAPVGAQQSGAIGFKPSASVVDAAHESAQTPSAGASDSAVLAFFKNTEVSGFVDTYYGYNFNTPATRTAGPERTFDTRHNSFSLNLAELALEKKPTAESRGGFRFDLDYGPTAATVHAAEPGGTAVFQNIGQAYFSYLAPVGKGLQFDIGEFVTPAGYEVIKTKDNWNYSRSLLFTLAIPFYHMGVRTTYAFSDRFALSGFVVNGWNNIVDNNTGKTVAVSATVKPTQALTITQLYMGGPEQTDDNSAWRHLSDTVVAYTVTPQFSLAGNYDYGRDQESGATVTWQGVAGYVRYQPKPWFALSPRAEYYNDVVGFTSGMAQKIKEITVTAELKRKDGVMMRIEYRRDFSDIPFFLKNDRQQVANQQTLTVGVIYAFSTKAP
jgi:hypothetical protein